MASVLFEGFSVLALVAEFLGTMLLTIIVNGATVGVESVWRCADGEERAVFR
jgi:glycerol uptake facilitator-like aquaporin